ncbi:TetR/AcrR family transcriptional regulator [Brevibacterium sp. GP-SGM9]|uniref:TetR/AcrR family transcriptional regulator n=1 Tax=unclassified Brevibacterium TaxID=2614124 RepID=UPI001E53A5DD|nr:MULTISPECIES: TetR/AcrR family transcriptional regulator C-terminal domain-containing protein [unclassified Brevibacterium]MCD1287528.1 TetR family transcriptional regulator [Brevibacterium sp. CCUG 69071]MDK8436664.1 TetR/AcrR family transcriptional regulator C-terminal domain-containing protein [Brevibacterium sp. H-BE7]
MARGHLNRRDIVLAAIAYIDTYGVQALTMRRLGSSLGVEAMALYRHVPGREELISAAVSELIDDLFDDDLMQETPTSWEGYLQSVANATRKLALGHPRIFPLMITQPPEAPWLRPPLRSIRWVDHFLSSLKSYGFTDSHAVDAYKAFTSFLLGNLLLQVSALGVNAVPVSEGEGDHHGDEIEDLDDYPIVKQLRGRLSADHSDREFDDGLDDLIERLRTAMNT